MDEITYRRGTTADAEVLARHRSEMFREMGSISPEGYEALRRASADYFLEAVSDDRYFAWLAVNGEQVIGGGGMTINPILPRPGPDGGFVPAGRQGLILNVFVEPEFRGRGIARELMRRMVEFANKQGIRSVVLHASQAGRPMYERLGFTPTSEMRLWLEPRESAEGP